MGGSGVAPTKLAGLVTEQICADIEGGGWRVGTRLGNEAELLGRHGVSRAVLREAIALLEYRGVVEVRRGHRGGVYVARPPDEVVVTVLTAHLRTLKVSTAEVFEARQLVEGLAVTLAADRIDEPSALRLRDHVHNADPFSIECDFHDAIAELSRNTLVAVTARALRRVLIALGPADYERCDDTTTAARDAHQTILDALIGGDAPTALHRLSDHLRAFESTVGADAGTPDGLDPERWRTVVRTAEPGERLAFRLARFIAVEAREVTDETSLGSENALLVRYQVSRAVLREAIRILEFDGVAEMRKGPGGGLTVIKPNRRAALAEFERFATGLDLSAIQVAEFLTAIELGSLDLVIDRLDQQGRDRLIQALAAEHAAPDTEFDGSALHVLLSDLTQNRVLSFLAGALRRMFVKRVQSESPDQLRFLASHARGAHDGIVEALLANDRALAQLRMREHIHQASGVFATVGPGAEVAGHASVVARRALRPVLAPAAN